MRWLASLFADKSRRHQIPAPAVTMEDCTFSQYSVNGGPPQTFFVAWACSCGHATKKEHHRAMVRDRLRVVSGGLCDNGGGDG